MKKNTIINVVKMLIMFTAFLFNDIFMLIPVYIFRINTKTMSSNTYYLLMIFSYICLIGIGLILYGKELKQEWKKFKSNRKDNIDTAVKYYFIGLGIMIASNILINLFLKLGNSQNEVRVQSMIKSSPWIMLICVSIFAPIVEEILFRKTFKNVFKKKYVFIFVSGFIFGLLHIIGYKLKTPLELLYIIPYGALGLSFALMDYEVDSTFPSIFMHMFHNAALTILSIVINML